MNFKDLDGYEFEILISELLIKMSFVVEQTALSGDGGIDIIAHTNKPILRGKYLVQCKNWVNPVGEPYIRDLYGATISENANKGILITTSHFTAQANRFAENKNMELIDRNGLVELLNAYNIKISNNVSQETSVYFLNNSEFDRDMYYYLRKRIDEDRTTKLYYDNLKDFYHNHVISNKYDININGLLDEYIDFNNTMLKRFYKGSKAKIDNGKAINYLNAHLYLLKGEMFKPLEIYKDLGILNSQGNLSLSLNSYRSDFIHSISHSNIKNSDIIARGIGEYGIDTVMYRRPNNSPVVVLKNIYLLFVNYKYETGIEFLEDLLDKNYGLRVRQARSSFDKECYEYIYKESRHLFEEIKEKKETKLHHPVKLHTYKDAFKEIVMTVDYREDLFVDINDLLNTYHKNKKEEISSDLDKIHIILSY